VVYDGAFIGGSDSAFKESLTLTLNDGDPPPGPIIVTRGYRITKEIQENGECHITVSFDRLGTITENLIFHPRSEAETASIWILCEEGTCKVHMDDKHYGLPPHVGKEGILAWLRKLHSGDQAAKVAALEKIVRSLSWNGKV
jgi:hypothetical protein